MALLKHYLTIFVLLCSSVYAQNPEIRSSLVYQAPRIVERQVSDLFSTIGLVCAGCPITTPSPISSSTASTIASTSISSRFAVASKTTAFLTSSSTVDHTSTPAPIIATGPYDPRALTTTFTQPAACTDYAAGFSVIEEWSDGMWYNAIYSKLPLSLYSSCFPPQFYSSVLATTSGLPFTALICPYNWEPYDFNTTYMVCCPPGFMVVVPELDTNHRRPGEGAYCYSDIGVGALMDVTHFDSTGGSTYHAVTAGSMTSNVVMADAFDGIALTTFTDPPLLSSTATVSSNGMTTDVQSSVSSVAVSLITENPARLSSSKGVAQTTLKTSSASRMSFSWRPSFEHLLLSFVIAHISSCII
ncbi:hypothetical protein BKA64DRAFT_745034 [Cadophora sp. MPI-SDFR-AT-0126]|nr:hypothetical protein BKA64DRAFT_745034 [Leotiomycetes sp. MPI-SDFR-AT-0126]